MKKPALADKELLNPDETIRLYGLSSRKFRRLLKQDPPFVIMYNTRRLIRRTAFDTFLKAHPAVCGDLRNGPPPLRKQNGPLKGVVTNVPKET